MVSRIFLTHRLPDEYTIVARPERNTFGNAAAPPSSSGLGHHPFKVEITGSNPVGGTKTLCAIFLSPARALCHLIDPAPPIACLMSDKLSTDRSRPIRLRG